MIVTERPSPNFDTRAGHNVDMLVLHYTGMRTGKEALDRLCNPDAKVSAHYVVEENGDVFKLVPETARAWHAGISKWRGHDNINQRSIGVEIVNPGHEFGYRPFPAVQMKSVTLLCKEILARNKNIELRNIVGHSDIAPSRKEDPGEYFDWQTLGKFGIGLLPKVTYNESPAEKLADYGYDITDLPKAITAFQRHYRQKDLTGQWDKQCSHLLAGLLMLI
ncbi:MAG: N-acetylmuramoyl-L-alanine amidase [Alphaproteobacteria bacterium]